eukprot:CAMPEP_0167798462 /NCGR_PEP_ID=MMETSP0111_2-20121227/16336_1 /TAXON_ID=91324 /ORGANISM="Lotharella globosa, Strain CCCM811" /LENGTH=64 /DNA_ID=CAMNT_0007692907 /DNA_START=30 /DNA_END=224 /DNA_ORIENTATION=+
MSRNMSQSRSKQQPVDKAPENKPRTAPQLPKLRRKNTDPYQTSPAHTRQGEHLQFPGDDYLTIE